MGLFRDRRDRRDLSLKVCWTLAVWLMTQQLRCDVNELVISGFVSGSRVLLLQLRAP